MLLQTDGLTKRYAATTALDALTLSASPGIVGLIGANGAGKSTLIKILLGLLAPTTGTARVLDMDVRTKGDALRQQVGYMPEYDCLPGDVSATEFVAHMAQVSGLPRHAARERTADTLRHVGLAEERYRLISGYSTGMRQRVKLAQAIVHDPRVVFLDEPTNGLDPAGRDEMLQLIARIGQQFGISVLLSTHVLSEIQRVCDSIILIDAGRLMAQGPLAEFTAATQILELEIDGDAERFAAELRTRGVTATVQGRRIDVPWDGAGPHTQIRDACADLDVGLVRMQQRHLTLEQLFRREPPADPLPTEGTGHD